MATAMPPRARPLVRYVAYKIGEMLPLGIVWNVGHDADAATLLASKRWRFGRSQLRLVPWDDCTNWQRAHAAVAEANDMATLQQQELAEALRSPS